jgi:hypothetical protein
MRKDITQNYIDVANKELLKHKNFMVKYYQNNSLERKKIEKSFDYCISLNKRLFQDYTNAKNQKKLL